MTYAEVMRQRHIDIAGELWSARSRRTWAHDPSILTDAGVALPQR